LLKYKKATQNSSKKDLNGKNFPKAKKESPRAIRFPLTLYGPD
jgi:hypothetical protein